MDKKRIQKRHIAALIAGLAILVAGISALNISSAMLPSSNPDQYVARISPETAANIAIAHISTDRSNLVKVDLDNENGVHVYSADFIIRDQEVSVEIDPQTSKVLVVEQEPIGTPDTDDDGDEDEDEE